MSLYFLIEPTRGEAILQGRCNCVDRVLRQRQNDPKCNQLPRGDELPHCYQLKVAYGLIDEGKVMVETVDITFPGETRSSAASYWSPLYRQFSGHPEHPQLEEHRYYLEDDGLAPIVERIQRWVDNREFRLLVQQGPFAFGDEFELADQILLDEAAFEADCLGSVDEEDVDDGEGRD